MNHLSGKTALVTGASRGIGRATALALAKVGAQVLVHYSSGEKEATAVVDEIRRAGGEADKLAADLRAPDRPHQSGSSRMFRKAVFSGATHSPTLGRLSVQPARLAMGCILKELARFPGSPARCRVTWPASCGISEVGPVPGTP